ncbi:MAG: lysophospholipid acyltransferase family protein [Mesorhizobium sp.]|nr:lysophospholipid acyltransferase family protein [Mesorhizobium sp.]MCO5160293.1 lysophospholipid acyltransferase family protein [Mesorhizobium sp.]
MPAEDEAPRPVRKRGPLGRAWRRIRKPLADSRVVKNLLASLLANGLRLVKATNPIAEGSDPFETFLGKDFKYIYALWHGQHLLAPAYTPKGQRFPAMFSRSADAELNALAASRLGLEPIRGSGGREGEHSLEKGGARALIALKKALDQGRSVCMIADIPHGTPREAGMGIITLSRISGRPIVGVAFATSRRKVIEKSWDKTTINLPFGRCGVAATEPIQVPKDATESELEDYRRRVTEALNEATARAYRLADGRS